MSPEWTKTQFFHSGDEYFQSIQKAILEAQKSIFIESYIFSVDPLTRPILDALKTAKQKGLDVRLLVDGFGSYYWIEALQKICQESEIPFKVYHPLPRQNRLFRYLSIVFTFRFSRLLRRLNRRNHRKIVLIDEERLWLGSLNMTQEHSETIMGTQAWRDSAVQLEGPEVAHIRPTFEQAWQEAGRQRLFEKIIHLTRGRKKRFTTRLLRINNTYRERFRIYRNLIKKINQADRSIEIVSAYFLPKRSFLRALKKAQRRGVEIKILIPGPSDVPVVKLAAYPILKWLLKNNVQVFEYQGRVLHAKYSLIDQIALIGSANLNHRSFLHDLEIEAILTNSEAVDALRIQFQIDLQNSRPVTLTDLQNATWFYKGLARLAFSVRYLL